MKQTIVIASLSEIDAAAQEFLRRLGDRRLVAFYAPMGAGKTTFITALCRVLGVRSDAVTGLQNWKRRWTSACTTIWTAARSA